MQFVLQIEYPCKFTVQRAAACVTILYLALASTNKYKLAMWTLYLCTPSFVEKFHIAGNIVGPTVSGLAEFHSIGDTYEPPWFIPTRKCTQVCTFTWWKLYNQSARLHQLSLLNQHSYIHYMYRLSSFLPPPLPPSSSSFLLQISSPLPLSPHLISSWVSGSRVIKDGQPPLPLLFPQHLQLVSETHRLS